MKLAVFVAASWLSQAQLRDWVKSLADGTVVLLTDDLSDGNMVLLRQLKCSEVVVLVARTPGMMRSVQAIETAKRRRDEAMAAVADSVVDFGEMPGGSTRFAGQLTLVQEER